MLFFDDVAFSWSTAHIRVSLFVRFCLRLTRSYFQVLVSFCLYFLISGIIVCFALRSFRTSTLFDILWECVYFPRWWFSFWLLSNLSFVQYIPYTCICFCVSLCLCVFDFRLDFFSSWSFFFRCVPGVQFFKSIVCRRLSAVRWIFARKVFPISEPHHHSGSIEASSQRALPKFNRVRERKNEEGREQIYLDRRPNPSVPLKPKSMW